MSAWKHPGTVRVPGPWTEFLPLHKSWSSVAWTCSLADIYVDFKGMGCARVFLRCFSEKDYRNKIRSFCIHQYERNIRGPSPNRPIPFQCSVVFSGFSHLPSVV